MMFKTIKAKNEIETTSQLIRGEWSFLIPGVNSGIYKPTTLHIQTKIEEFEAKMWGRLKKHVTSCSITLSRQEFDDLYNEMTKIKELRDNPTLNK